MSAQDSSSPSDSDRASRIHEIVEEFLRHLQQGRSGDVEELVHSNPDLAPDLQRRLEIVARKHRGDTGTEPGTEETQAQFTDGPPVRPPPAREERASWLNCPHCGNEIQLVGVQMRELTCASCGSQFGFDQESTREFRTDLPEMISRFQIREQLGRGGFGIVYKGFDPKLSRDVAIKVPRAGYFVTTTEEERFLREARNAASLRHPNIVQIYEVISDDTTLCLVAELIEGLTLSDLMSAGRLSYAEIVKLVVQIGGAVDFAHQRGVIHRDIKPNNILLDTDRKPYLSDFGLARQNAAEITMTIDGEILGTPAYMAPEQAAGQQSQVDARSDVYSLGVMLYRMLTGELPFRGSQRMLLHQVMNEDPPALRRLNDSVPRDLEVITLKAMSKEKEARYQSARELVDELDRWLRHEPIKARPLGIAGRLLRWSKRKPVVATLAATIVALACCLIAGSVVWGVRESVLRNQADIARTEAVESEKRNRARLARLYTRTGLGRIRQNDLLGSLPWFVEALGTHADDLDAVKASRFRLGMILQQCPTLLRVVDTGSAIHCVTFSPDGAQVLAAGESGIAKLYSLNGRSGDPVELSHAESLRFAEFSADGSRLLAVTRANVATLWNLDGPERIAELSHDDMVWHGSFSPDGKYVLTGGLDHTVRIWNPSDGSAIATLDHEGAAVNRIVVSPTSKHFVSLSAKNVHEGWLRIWDLETQAIVGNPIALHGKLRAAAFNRAGSVVVCSGGDATARAYDVQSSEPVCHTLQHESPVKWIGFLDDDDQVATATVEGKIRVWSISQHAIIGEPFTHGGALRNAAMAGSPVRMATVGDGNARVWWASARRPLCSSLTSSGSPIAIALEDGGTKAAVGSDDGTLRVWDLASAVPSGWILPHEGEVALARFSPDGSTILTASRDGTGRLWNRRTGEPIGEPLSHAADVLDAVFNHNGSLCATAGADNQVKIWDGFTAAMIGDPLGHPDHVIRAKFAPASNRLATGCDDGSVRIWLVGNPEPIATFHHSGSIRCLRFDADGQHLAVGSADGTARVWSVSDGRAAGPPLEHAGPVGRCEFHPSEPWLLTASRSHMIRVWDWKTGREAMTALAHSAPVPRFTLNAETNQLLSIAHGGTANLWDLSNPFSLMWSFDHPATDLSSEDIHPNGRFLLSAGGETASRTGRIDLWDGATGLPLSPPLKEWSHIRTAVFGPDGDTIVSASIGGTAQLWTLESEERSIVTLQDLAAILAGYQIDERFRASALFRQDQASLFQKLSVETPRDFATTAADREAWDRFVQSVVLRESGPPLERE